MGKLTESHSYDDIQTKCFYITFDLNDKGEVFQSEDKWCEEIFDEIPNFALGKTKAQEISKDSPRKAVKQGMNLLYKVKEIQIANTEYLDDEASIKLEDKYLRRGEFGELILYYLLDKKLNKPQLISKVYFKDSYNSVVHGFDAVHYDKLTNHLWIGESKFYKNLTNALSELSKDLYDHFNVDFFEQEFTVINNRFSDLNLNNEELRKLIDPSTRFISKLVCINACFFALFNSEVIDSFSFVEGTDKPTQEFLDSIEELVSNARSSFNDKNSNYPLNENFNIHLFLFPVKSKYDLVKKLHKKLKKEQY